MTHRSDGINVWGDAKKHHTNSIVPTVRGEFSFNPSVSFALLVVVIHSLSFSQLRSIPTLARVQEYILHSKIAFPLPLYSSNQPYKEIAYYDALKHNISILRNDGNGIFGQPEQLDTINAISSMSVGNINNDGIDDIVVVQRESNRVILFLSDKTDATYSRQSFSVGFYPESALIQDISGDGIADVIVLGKLSSGVTVIRGRRDGMFAEPKTLFSDSPVSSLSIIRLNGDNIPDVVVRNWLSNEDIFYFGLGNLQFSEQSALSYGADSTSALFEDVNNDGITDAIVTSTQYQSLLVYHSDGLGNFDRVQSVSLMGTASSLIRTSFTGKLKPDILLIHNGAPQFSLLLNKENGSFYDEIVFGIPYKKYTLASEDINSDGLTDIICFDSDSARYSVYWNQQTMQIDTSPSTFAVGRTPNNLFVTDINDDGFDDLFVSNGGSNTISILLGSAKSLSSQVSVETPDGPTSVNLYMKTDSALTFITSHGDDSKIGITSLYYSQDMTSSLLGEIESYTIALTGKPSFILPDISMRSTPLSLYVFLRGQTNSIVFYQQLQSTQFIAKSLTPLIPSRIMFSTISDLNSDGFTDLVYIYNDKRMNRDLIGMTLNDAKGEFTGRTYTVTLSDTGHRRSYVWVEDLNMDQQKDYIFYSYPEKTLYAIIAKKDGEFTQLVTICQNVSLSHHNQVKFYDFDRDGVDDLIYSDTEFSKISLLRNKGNGTFYREHILVQMPNVSHFQCGDFDGDGIADFAFPQSQKNTVEVLYGKKK